MSHDPPVIVLSAPTNAQARSRLLRALLPEDPGRARRLRQGLDARPCGWDFSVLAESGGGGSASAAIILDRAGGCGTLLPPLLAGHGARQAAGGCAVREVIRQYRARVPDGVVITLTTESDHDLNHVLASSGMARLTTLVFLRTRVESPRASAPCPGGFRVAPLPDDLGAVAEVLRASCADSLDCPELGARRRPERVLEGHLDGATSIPRQWLGAYSTDSRCSRLVGLSLTRARVDADAQAGEWDLIYIGMAPQARGIGVGRFLLAEQLRQLDAAGGTTLALACDARNTPALTLYASVGFHELGRRVAWLDDPTT